MSRRIIGALIATALLAPNAARAAGLDKCTKTVAVAVEGYVKAKQKAISQCEDKRSKGKLDAEVNCRPAAGAVTDAKTATKLQKAADKVQKKIAAKCSSLPPLGPACDSATSIAELVACITAATQDADVEHLNVDTLIDTVYSTDVPITDKGLQKCQAAISKEGGKYLVKRMKTLRVCENNRAKGKVSACPDAKATAKLDKARAKLAAGIAKKCTDAQVDPAASPGLAFSTQCRSYDLISYQRSSPSSNDNALSFVDRLVGCIADAHAGVADRMAAIGLPAPEASAFTFGVAAGDATDTAVVFWTRLPNASAPGALDVATDEAFSSDLQTFDVSTVTDGDGTAKIDVTGLSPHTTYFYRFRQGSDTSPTGRVVTAPSASDNTTVVRFGWSGDTNAYNQPFTSLNPLREAAPDAWFYIGDTIYGDDPLADGLVAQTVPEYESKYRSNRADAALRNLMTSTGTYVQWDDHEVRNDFSGAVPAFASRMAAGNFAFRRYFPIREDGSDPMRLYRKFQWGTGAEFFVIDDRQYRSAKYTCCEDAAKSGLVTVDEVFSHCSVTAAQQCEQDSDCPEGEFCANAGSSTCGATGGEALLPTPACTTAMAAASRTYLGAAQKQWLKDGLQNSTASFKFIMNGPPITELLFNPYDHWEGYPAERNEILDFIQNNDIQNVIWLSTDFHALIVSGSRVDATHQVPEIVSGSIGENTLFNELDAVPAVLTLLPTIPSILTQVTDYELNRYNGVLITVTPGNPTTAQFDVIDRTGAVIRSLSYSAS